MAHTLPNAIYERPESPRRRPASYDGRERWTVNMVNLTDRRIKIDIESPVQKDRGEVKYVDKGQKWDFTVHPYPSMEIRAERSNGEWSHPAELKPRPPSKFTHHVVYVHWDSNRGCVFFNDFADTKKGQEKVVSENAEEEMPCTVM
ncbi:unnamed protein product [Symbiodinium sp. CCMP2456]|nr:unnamed protein product [Symbiodinium sp. CCMP2456]